MSHAFIREGDDQWLSDVSPTMNALIIFLTKENNGIRVYEKENYIDAAGRHIYVMSNGLILHQRSAGEMVNPHGVAQRVFLRS